MVQTVKPAEVLIFDTVSTDGSASLATQILRGIRVRLFTVMVHEFDHGGTRNRALKEARYPWVLFLTQDAVCANAEAFANLLSATRTKGVIAAYGRQLPYRDATPLAATARDFNYGTTRLRQDLSAMTRLGIKTWFCSNSFCVWNKKALQGVGGFAEKLILGEDMHAAARLIQAGGTVIYEPTAEVWHSHNYTALQEFRRYFDIGVFHRQHRALLFVAGKAEGEGVRFAMGQFLRLYAMRAWWSLLKLPIHVLAKFLGYKLGQNYTLLGKRLARACSMHRMYWS